MPRRLIAVALLLVVATAACADTNSATQKDQNIAKQQLTGFQNNQPIPVFTYSQLRQNLIEIETSQANSTQTTSFFFNQGVQDPITTCPSIGYPIPATYQLSNPQQIVNGDNGRVSTVPQIEANGVYTGDTSATYVICVDASGKAYANYWEGFVSTVTGPAVWDEASHTVHLTGAPTATFTTAKK